MKTEKLVLFVLFVLVIPIASGAIYINEIVPNPVDDCLDCTEWLELYNGGEDDVNIGGWVLNDSTGRYIYINSNYSDSGDTVIISGGYLALSNFSYGFRLRNTGDVIRLMQNGSLVDEVSYTGFDTKASYDMAWARVPDGSNDWFKQVSTRGASNGAMDEPEDASESDEGHNASGEEGNSDSDNSIDEIETANDEDVSNVEIVVESQASDSVKVTGKTVYVAEEKNDITKPLLLLLLGLLVIAVILQMQLVRKREGFSD